MAPITVSLAGQLAVVTGGASGIGKAIALRLAVAGATLVVLDRQAGSADDELREAASLLVDVDVLDRVGIQTAADRVLGDFGAAHVLVNSAGFGLRYAAVDHDAEAFSQMLSVNVLGTFNCCQLIGRHMLDAGRGSIVNVSSVGALVSYAGSVGYQASKAAVSHMTRSLAVEWAPRNVRVNAIAPGHTRTPLVERLWEREPQLRDFFLSRTPMGKLAVAEDMAGAILFLASDDAAVITGQVLAIDGGFSLQ